MANSAPVLNTSLTRINSIYEDTYTGSVPASFFNDGVNALGTFVPGATDVDGNLLGIAIIGQTGIAGGLLEYSVDNLHWFTAVMPPIDYVLVFKGDTQIRYTPPVDANGTSTLTYRTWDGTGGYNSGDVVNITTVGTGGSTPFSVNTATHQLIVTPDDGKVITDLGGYDNAVGVAIDANGKIVVAGSSYNIVGGGNSFAFTRYNSDGSLDTSFSLDGKVIINAGPNFFGVDNFEIDANGKYLLTGFSSAYNPLSSTTTSSNVIARFNTDGTLDATFGTGGIISTPLSDGVTSNYYSSGSSIALQANGSIVDIGTLNNSGLGDFMVLRRAANGALDTTFDTDGIVTTGFGVGNNGIANNVLLQSDGKIIAVGTVVNNTAGFDLSATNVLVRYNSNGSIDTTFGNNGFGTTGIASFDIGMGSKTFASATLQADGKILITGTTAASDPNNLSTIISGDVVLARINTNGTLDTGFGVNGVITTDMGGNDDASIVKVQGDGKILVAGESIRFGNQFIKDLSIARYNSNGTLDSTFGTNGKLLTGFPFNNIEVSDLTIQADGKIVITGTSGAQDEDFATIRLNANGTLDNTFVGQNNAPVFNIPAPILVNTFSGDVAFEVPASAGVSASDADGRFGDQIGSIITSVSATSSTGDLLQINSSEYSTNGGVTWFAMPTLALGSGIVLAGTSLLRYTSAVGASGNYSITYRAWDGTGSFTSGQVVTLASIGSGGGTSPFSTGSATLNVNVIGATDGTVNADNMTAVATGSYLRGLAGNDSITGSIANDKLDGGDNNDTINGGDGSDRLFGGNGDDTLIDSDNYVADTLDGGAGVDTVSFNGAFTAINANLALGTATIIDSLGNILVTNTLIGIENLTGTTNNDVLTGDGFANVLIGDLGTDTLIGGNGNDHYVIDNSSDIVTETNAVAATGGTDIVEAYASFTLGANLENLSLSGTAAINGIGNALSNRMTGNVAANYLNGGAGIDTLIGGDGNDHYVIDNSSDIVTETNAVAATGGTDIVEAYASFTLGANLENLSLSGTATINGTGNTLNNTIIGNGGSNILTGGLGSDTMRGNLGADTFDFNALLESVVGVNRDIIADFSALQLDKIDLSTIDANSTLTNDQAFATAILTSGAFTAEGQLRLVGNILSGNTDSDFATSEFEIQLTGVATLVAADFVL